MRSRTPGHCAVKPELSTTSPHCHSGNMLTTVIPRLVNASDACHLLCVHLTSLSSLQSATRTTDFVAASAVRRGMSETAAGARTPYFQHFWKPGSGYYSDSLGKRTKGATDICEDFVLSHIDYVQVPSPKGVFTIGDYGTCDGSVSLQLMHKIIGKYKKLHREDHLRNKHGSDLKIQVLYEDQPSNDYNSLFKTIYGNTSYMEKFDNVFPLVCGTSFYKQCVPDNSCDIILSSFATQWLNDESHVKSSNTISPWWSTSEEELRAYCEASARDWKTFLLLRAAELKRAENTIKMLEDCITDVKLVFGRYGSYSWSFTPSQNPKSSPAQPGAVTEPGRDTWINLNLSWNELYAEGKIANEEFQSCSVPIVYRTLEELQAPFQNATMSPVRQSGLNLLKEPEEFALPCFAKTTWQRKLQSDGADDRNMFAQNLANSFRVILEPTLRNSLNTRSFEEQSGIVEQFFERFIRKVASLSPETFQSEIIVRRLVAQKLQ